MFVSAHLKIDRANHHLRDLESGIRNLADLNQISVQPDPEGRGHTIEHKIPNLPEIMNKFALLIGDAVHNFRTALDHAWVDSVKKIGLLPTQHTKFPVRQDLPALQASLEGITLHTASPRLFDVMLHEIKAYAAGNDFLWALHHLDIADKHELLLPIINYASINDIRVQNKAGEVIAGSTWGGEYPDVIRIDIPATHNVQYHGDRSMSIILKHAAFPHHIDVTELLKIFSRLTTHIVQTLRQVTQP